jgi:hypothetical protein
MKIDTLKEIVLVAVFILLCAVSGFSQQKTPKAKETKQPEMLPVSSYMRQMGLLYLEALQKYEDGCWKAGATTDSCELAQHNIDDDGVLKAIEDRMDIHISEYPSEGDKAYRGLLKTTYYAEANFMSRIYLFKLHAGTSEEMFKSSSLAKTCTQVAHEISLKGIFDDSLWSCEMNFKKYIESKK